MEGGNVTVMKGAQAPALLRIEASDILHPASYILHPTSDGPCTSCLLKPVISTALRFHSLTSPSASMPKMGAFAVSISMRKSLATRDNSIWLLVISVMSWPTPTTPTTLPAASTRGVAFNNTCAIKSGQVKAGGQIQSSQVTKPMVNNSGQLNQAKLGYLNALAVVFEERESEVVRGLSLQGLIDHRLYK